MVTPAASGPLAAKVQVGEQTPWGVATEFGHHPMAFGDGWWVCATHGITSFADREAFVVHIDDPGHLYPCRIAWRCRADDQVHGFSR